MARPPLTPNYTGYDLKTAFELHSKKRLNELLQKAYDNWGPESGVKYDGIDIFDYLKNNIIEHYEDGQCSIWFNIITGAFIIIDYYSDHYTNDQELLNDINKNNKNQALFFLYGQ